MKCNNCQKEKLIVNKKYGLCQECNHKRLHGGKSMAETQAEQHQRYVNNFRARVKRETDNDVERRKIYMIKSSGKKIKQQTKKEGKIKSVLSDLKRNIEMEAVQSDQYFCQGCGQSHPGLDKSHLLSVSQHKHLELIKENIQLLCRTCHMTWEGGHISEQIDLHCFVDNLEFIIKHDLKRFNKFIVEIQEYRKWLVDSVEIKKVDNLLKRLQNLVENCPQ